jgi:primosomal protein N''
MIEPALARAEEKMKASVEALKRELTGVRTGRASPALVEHVKIDYKRRAHAAQSHRRRLRLRHQHPHHPALGPLLPEHH